MAPPEINLEVLHAGPFAVLEDLGRPGLAHLGVGQSGAADRHAHRLANRLVANPDDRATVEVTFGGFSARVCGGDVDIAVTGADTNPTVNGKLFGTNSIRHVRDGQVISLGAPRAGGTFGALVELYGPIHDTSILPFAEIPRVAKRNSEVCWLFVF